LLKTFSKLDEELGILYYASGPKALKGRLRQLIEDFIVEEILHHKPSGGSGNYTFFTLKKGGIDTNRALLMIARALGLSVDMFNVAGMKDAKALTKQFVTVRAPPEALASLKVRGVSIEGVERVSKPLLKRCIRGNLFRVTIRGLRLAKEEIAEVIKELWQQVVEFGGLPNYYGYQRFGTVRSNTHKVGKLLVQGRVKDAVLEFLAHPYPNEARDAYEARKELSETLDFAKALKRFPRRLTYEIAMLRHLAKRSDDYVGALRRLPLRVLKLFIQAYQSYLFNRVLSSRIEWAGNLRALVDGDRLQPLNGEGFSFTVTKSSISEAKAMLNSGRAFLILPVLGFNSLRFEGSYKPIVKDILEEEGVKLEDFKVSLFPDLRFPGSFRRASVLIKGLVIDEAQPDEVNEGCLKVRISYELERGAYATIFLRELIKPSDPLASGF